MRCLAGTGRNNGSALLLFLTATTLPLIAGTSLAQNEAADQTESSAALEPITVVAHRQPRRLSEVAGTVTVFGEERLGRDLVFDLTDLVRYEPGVELERGDTRFGPSGFRIRGVGGNRTAVLVDQVPAPDRFTVGSFADSGRGLVDMGLAGRVEILRGPASTLYGSKALGGVVAISLLDVDDVLANGDRGLRLGAAGASDADRYRLSSVVARQHERTGMLLGASFQRSGSVDAAGRPAETPMDDISVRQSALLSRLAHATGFGRLRFTLDAMRESRYADLKALLGSGRLRNTSRLIGDDRRNQWRLLLDQELDPLGPIDRGRWRLWHQVSDTAQETFDQRPLAATPIDVFRRFELRQDTSGFGVDLESDLVAFDLDQRLGYGLELTRTRVRNQRDGVQTNLSTGETTKTIIGERFPLRDFPASTISELGIYLHDEIRLWPDGPMVSPGLRFEAYDLSLGRDPLFESSFPNANTTELDSTAWLPRMGLLWPVSKGSEIFVQYARGFRAPPFDDVNIGLEYLPFGVRAIANPDLKPERGRTLEAGLRWRGQRARAELAIYRNDYQDFIQSRAPLGFDPESGFLLFQSINKDRVRIEGGELRSQLQLDEGFGLAFSAWFGRGEDTRSGRSLPDVAPPGAIAELNWTSRDGRLETRLIGQATRAQRRLEDAQGDPLFSPSGSMTIDWLTRYFPSPDLEIAVGLFNLTDRQTWRAGRVSGRAPDDPTLPLLAEPGRSVMLQIQWRG